MGLSDNERTTLEKQICIRATQWKIPVNALFELTPLCNMNCEMCYVRLNPEELRKKGSLHTADEWIALAEEMKEEGVVFVLLTGGEPLLYPDFKKLYLALRKMGMILSVNTNGTLLNEKWADFFAENIPRRINITLYGANRESYERLCHYPDGFDRALSAIKLLKNRGVSVKINGSITTANQEEREALVRLAEELNTYIKIDTYMYPATRERNKPFSQQSRITPKQAAQVRVELLKRERTPDEFEKFAKQMLEDAERETEKISEKDDRVRCRAGRSSFSVNWEGNMSPCVFLTTPQVNVFERGFTAAWEKITEETENIRLNSKCSTCRLKNICQNCAACAMAETGSFSGVPQYMCQYTEETLALLRKEIGKTFQIGNFAFRLQGENTIEIPKNFQMFEKPEAVPEYTYEINIADKLPPLDGKLTAKRPDIDIYNRGNLESRLLKIRGSEEEYAVYQEVARNRARVILCKEKLEDMHIDPVFTSMLALEKKMLDKDSLIFHCAYLRKGKEAILFSGPSGIGKSTQAGLWEQYENGEVINGDRALLIKTEERWIANGWPVSGTSGICNNISAPIKAIVMLNQSRQNQVRRLDELQAVQQLYAQTTVNYWNVASVRKSLDLLEDLTEQIPVYHLECDISENAVGCLKNILENS